MRTRRMTALWAAWLLTSGASLARAASGASGEDLLAAPLSGRRHFSEAPETKLAILALIVRMSGTPDDYKAVHSLQDRFSVVPLSAYGKPYTPPAGTVEPSVAEADKALASGSSDAVVKLVTDAVATGIRERYERAVATYKHKDESVMAGREFVEAYVEYTHYVERLHLDATGRRAHDEHHQEMKHTPAM